MRTLARHALLAAALLATASTAAAQAPGDRATVWGIVYDSLANTPLRGAMVQLVPAGGGSDGVVFNDTTDADGVFSLDSIPAGRYLLGFFHPVLDVLGAEPPVQLVQVEGTMPVRTLLTTPSPASVIAAYCPGAPANDSTGVVLGRVQDARLGMPLDSTIVALMWNELVLRDGGIRHERRRVTAISAANGMYAFCGVPIDGEIVLQAERGRAASGLLEITVPVRGVVVRDVQIDPTAVTDAARPRGTAAVTGVVTTADGQPAKDAHVSVWGTEITVTTGEDGRFALSELPAGTYAIEARAIGFSPTREPVHLVPDSVRTVDLALGERVAELDIVHVYGEPRQLSDLSGFLRRRERGFGKFVTRAEIEQRRPFRTTDLMRTMPGVRLIPGRGLSYTVAMTGTTGACLPVVYVDGMRISEGANALDEMVNPNDLVGVEVYTRAVEAPAEYSAGTNCGVVLVWTHVGTMTRK